LSQKHLFKLHQLQFAWEQHDYAGPPAKPALTRTN